MSQAEATWSDLAQAPGNSTFRIRSVRVKNDSGEVTGSLSSSEPFDIEIEYTNLSGGTSLGATVLLYNSDGVLIFSSLSNREQQWHGREFPLGTFRSVCRVPGHLLAPGRFEVSVLVWANGYSLSHREDCVVEFDVHDSGELRSDYFGTWLGVVRPDLEWKTEKIDDSERSSSPSAHRDGK
jgi:hypothetical protein